MIVGRLQFRRRHRHRKDLWRLHEVHCRYWNRSPPLLAGWIGLLNAIEVAAGSSLVPGRLCRLDTDRTKRTGKFLLAILWKIGGPSSCACRWAVEWGCGCHIHYAGLDKRNTAVAFGSITRRFPHNNAWSRTVHYNCKQIEKQTELVSPRAIENITSPWAVSEHTQRVQFLLPEFIL